MQILQQTLTKMKKTFSSKEFFTYARKKGVPNTDSNDRIMNLFLHQHAIQSESKRSWFKKDNVTQLEISQTLDDKLQEAINLLKKNGCKVMKQNTQWIEL